MNASALLLAGGRSRRLGRPKPLVDIAGRTVLERLLDATGPIDDVVLSVREVGPFEVELDRLGWCPAGTAESGGGVRDATAAYHFDTRRLSLVPDREPDLGPVAGLAAGLAAASADIAVVLAADLPFVTVGLVERLVVLLDGAPSTDAVIPVLDGRDHPLAAAYRTRVSSAAAALLDSATRRAAGPDPGAPLDSGTRGAVGPSVRALLDAIDVARVEASDLGPPDVIRRALRGIDTPEDLDWARASVL